MAVIAGQPRNLDRLFLVRPAFFNFGSGCRNFGAMLYRDPNLHA